jgi:hypothetical protein
MGMAVAAYDPVIETDGQVRFPSVERYKRKPSSAVSQVMLGLQENGDGEKKTWHY